MRKILLGISILSLSLLFLLSYSSKVLAINKFDFFNWNNKPHFNGVYNPDRNLSKTACGEKLGKAVVDVSQKVQNDVDDSFGNNDGGRESNWAFDYYTRHIQIWQTDEGTDGADNTYCAIVTYNGQFSAVPGQVGPGNNPADEKIHSPVDGLMSGGYRETFKGKLSPSDVSHWPVYGNVTPTTDYACVIYLAKGASANCPGFVSWIGKYFTSSDNFASLAMPWWGWQYKGGSHGTWTNAIDVTQPNSGNIL